MSTPKTILVLGAGPRVGLEILKKFSSNGYKTIGVSRNPSAELSKIVDLAISADFSDPSSIASIFSETISKIGIPNAVVYNTSASHTLPTPTDPFSNSVSDFIADLNVNITSPYAALQESILAWKSLPPSTKKTFIYTGNGLMHFNRPIVMNRTLGKRGGGVLIENAVITHGGNERGMRFYFADERKEDGTPAYEGIDGEAHGEFYLELAEMEGQGVWEATFVKGAGYRDFEGGVGPVLGDGK